MNCIDELLSRFPVMILDGALATELEKRGCDLNDPLWSAKLLVEDPDVIGAVHRDYLEAGADCIITASYQATYQGFAGRGATDAQAREYLRRSVEIARNVRDSFWRSGETAFRFRPLVAASAGPYGAYLADGSEYRGDYQLTEDDLMSFHRRRLTTLIEAGPDILAFETIPCFIEAKALVRLLHEFPEMACWVSFSARDGYHTRNGEKLADCARWLNDHPQVAAIGVNCTGPQYIVSLIREIRKETDKPVIVYPNSGEQYDGLEKCWGGGNESVPFGEAARDWFAAGARIIGGCCRTGPGDISAICRWARESRLAKE